MKKTKFLSIIIIAIILTIISVNYERLTPTIVGNLCKVTKNNPMGYCHENLPAGRYNILYCASTNYYIQFQKNYPEKYR